MTIEPGTAYFRIDNDCPHDQGQHYIGDCGDVAASLAPLMQRNHLVAVANATLAVITKACGIPMSELTAEDLGLA
ncbi:hypothetical protein [Gordonia sp. (in: high G+C Gram-positive bacteria)]|uniref:hypothetical protein n=1 Tax=Gordonia sp. (in: high G+C Gram-positive bacteria) TaxID=84139 RepID=UPI003C748BB7